MAVNLDAYFKRIGFSGEPTPTLSTLNALCLLQVKAMPFENLDLLLGRPIDLSDDAVDAKLVTAKRGGYCFEQNTLLLRVLLALGFEAKAVSARSRLQRARDFTPPRTHVFLRVEVDGQTWFADAGIGGLSPTCALRFVLDAEQLTPHESRRFISVDGRFFHQAMLAGAWADVCEFTLEEMPAIDRELANWFTSAHPQSHFLNRLMAARALDDGARLTLLNRDLTRRDKAGVASTMRIESPDHLLEVLDAEFGLRFPSGTRFKCAALDW